ncbi:MAG: substrate-binding domain-containing protein [Gammaproteobacteria bacterium]|nr:substrate-binding domain-containing protein [Gammaproteobacteria bacterium]MCP5459312.1 substrate-binding domain-containing protein [Gammaproteobacteria bacterium]
MTPWNFGFIVILLLVLHPSAGYAQSPSDRLLIVGSSTVYPLAEEVSKQYSAKTGRTLPDLESTGTGGGLKLFCAGVGVDTPSIVNASRRIKSSEVETCANNQVNDIVEVTVGYDAIVAISASTVEPLHLTRKELFLALAKEVPNPQGDSQLAPNPYKTWNEINPALPARKINVWGPDESHGTYELIVSNIMQAGCEELAPIKALKSTNPEAFKTACETFRDDGVFTEDHDYAKILAAVKNDPGTVGIVGYLFLSQDRGLQGADIDGITPTFGSIAYNKYPLTRPLRFYLKKAHVDRVPGLREYVEEFTSEAAWGTNRGYLVKFGMIPMPLSERRKSKANVEELTPLSL